MKNETEEREEKLERFVSEAVKKLGDRGWDYEGEGTEKGRTWEYVRSRRGVNSEDFDSIIKNFLQIFEESGRTTFTSIVVYPNAPREFYAELHFWRDRPTLETLDGNKWAYSPKNKDVKLFQCDVSFSGLSKKKGEDRVLEIADKLDSLLYANSPTIKAESFGEFPKPAEWPVPVALGPENKRVIKDSFLFLQREKNKQPGWNYVPHLDLPRYYKQVSILYELGTEK